MPEPIVTSEIWVWEVYSDLTECNNFCTLPTYFHDQLLVEFVLEESLSPYINRFVSADTIVPGYTNPQNLNRYGYVLNNPLRYTDPTGHCIDASTGNVNMGEYPYGTSGLCSSPTPTPAPEPNPKPEPEPGPIFEPPTEPEPGLIFEPPTEPILVIDIPVVIPNVLLPSSSLCKGLKDSYKLEYSGLAALYMRMQALLDKLRGATGQEREDIKRQLDKVFENIDKIERVLKILKKDAQSKGCNVSSWP